MEDLLKDFLGVSWAPGEELVTLPSCVIRSGADTMHLEQLQQDLWISVREPYQLVPFELE